MTTETKTPPYVHDGRATWPANPIIVPNGDNISYQDLERVYAQMIETFGVLDAKALMRSAMDRIDRSYGALRLLPMHDRPDFIKFLNEEIGKMDGTKLSPEAEANKTAIQKELVERYAPKKETK